MFAAMLAEKRKNFSVDARFWNLYISRAPNAQRKTIAREKSP
jgi:hypothetical protein